MFHFRSRRNIRMVNFFCEKKACGQLFHGVKKIVRILSALNLQLKGSVSRDFLGPFLACTDRSRSV
jgi:hypothetical protein